MGYNIHFEKCANCNGTGVFSAHSTILGTLIPKSIPCWTCRGTGTVERRPRFWMGAPA